MASQIVEVEFCSHRRWNLLFRPIMAKVRCRIDMAMGRSARERALQQHWKEPIPGVRACIDLATGKKWLRDPLHDEEFEEVRARILNKKFELPKKKIEYDSESVVTWVYHLQKLVDAGSARVIVGELPPVESFDELPKTSFIVSRQQDASATLVDAITALAESTRANTAMLQALAERIASKAGATPAK